MPIEIRELVIRTTVSPGSAQAGGGDGRSGSASGGQADRETLVAEIVREVMRALREQSER